MQQIKFTSLSWENYVKEFFSTDGYSYYKTIQIITDELADYQNEAEQEGWYLKSINLTLQAKNKSYIKNFILRPQQDTDKVIADYFAAAIAANEKISYIKIGVKLDK